MKKKSVERDPLKPLATSDIRRRAEEHLKKEKRGPQQPREENIEKLVHELEVHQVELEIQNEELRDALVALKTSRDQYLDLYDFAPVGYFKLDKKGLIIDTNLAGAGLIGADRSALVGRPFTDYVQPESQDAFYLHFKKVFKSGVREVCEVQLKREDGTPLNAHLESLASTRVGPSEVRMAVIDITRRTQAEHDLQHQTDQLSEANKEIEAFTYSVSHDLRAPLRAMDGFTKMILQEFGNAMEGEFRRKFEVIRDNTKLMVDLVDALLNLSRIGRREISRSRIDMKEKFRDVWAVIKAEVPERSIDFILEDMPPVFADRDLIRQVIYNLLSNAVKFTGNKEKARIEAGGRSEGGFCIYLVRDNGAGFDMRYYDKLFGVFQRLHSAAEYEGIGVGLASMQNIIHRHGGKVWAEGKVGKGATFYFSLPKE
jgi:PAS domain S-box-containing protein